MTLPTNAAYRNPTDECDLVMKGGVTSGIVYPPAILELAPRYRFRQIGGASVGAMAAAVTAAAEYGRESDREGSGFAGLGEMSTWLGEKRNLLNLFQPQPALRNLFRFALAALGFGSGWWFKLVPTLWICFPRGAAIGAIVTGALFAWGGSWLQCALGVSRHPHALTISLGVIGALAGGTALSVNALRRQLTRCVVANDFGLCSGLASPAGGGADALTPWLHGRIQTLAGLDAAAPPLTVGQLAAKRVPGPDGVACGITLQMVTTCLSHGRPYVLPFEREFLLFREDEMRRLFPAAIVDQLVHPLRDGRPAPPRRLERLDLSGLAGFHPLPEPDDLPIAFLARLSLSYPILMSAVPLYVVCSEALHAIPTTAVTGPDGTPHQVRKLTDPARHLQKIWFSDGGISSNFPIHFFDAWLPMRPTFAIDLTELPAASFEETPGTPPRYATLKLSALAESPDPTHASDPVAPGATPGAAAAPRPAPPAVHMPAANKVPAIPLRPVASLGNFVFAIWNTAQNFRDSTLAQLPSYRERIVEIAFAHDEGGINLAMGQKQIESIVGKGDAAGRVLLGFDFDDHCWVRFLVLMEQLESRLATLDGRAAHYDALIRNLRPGAPYAREADWRAEARAWLDDVAELGAKQRRRRSAWFKSDDDDARFFGAHSPRPRPVLRVTPEV